MKIMHLCLSCFYIDNFSYQENELPRQNKRDGHDVRIIASTETLMDEDSFFDAGEHLNEDGIPVKRLPYKKWFPKKVMEKIRAYQGLYQEMETFQPDIIMFHGLAAYDIITAAKYKKANPQITFIADSHEEYGNSARNFISKNILHRIFYRYCLRKAYPYIDQIWGVAWECIDFVREMYGISEKVVCKPLGGEIVSDSRYDAMRKEVRSQYQLKDDNIVFIHTGKLQRRKRVPEMLEAFKRSRSENMYLFLAGRFEDEDLEREVTPYLGKDHIIYLGWLDAEKLRSFLCASDVYLQLGSKSNTIHNALCNRCTYMVFPHSSYVKIFSENGGYYVRDVEDIEKGIKDLAEHPEELEKKRGIAFADALRLFDYKRQAEEMYRMGER
ncbi:MAG: glycosyltransferase family 4 protein [Lachnospiraceae bacterium]|nr:glycosyltransferase family 4 protein [Lachnospiraceae bacterium]